MNQFFRSKPFKRACKLTALSFLAILVLGAAVGLWYGGPSTPLDVENPPKCCLLTLDESVSIDEIVRAAKYKPLWIGNENVTVTVKADADGALTEIECDKLFTYDEKSETFTAKGIGKGTFTFTSTVDSAVSLTVPFEIGYKSAQTQAILKSEYPSLVKDGLLTAEEIASVTSITIRGAEVDAADLALFPALKSLFLSCENGVPTMRNLKNGWEYFVPTSEYANVISSTNWTPYERYVFPDVDKADDTFEVVFDPTIGAFAPNDNFEKNAYRDGLCVYLVKSGSKLNLASFVPLKQGYTFDAWETYGDSLNGINADKHPVNNELTENVKLKATWKENRYTVKFDLNGGSGSVAPATLRYSEEHTPYIVTLNRDGYDFLGWSTTPGGDVRFGPDDKLVALTDVNEDEVTLYAVWRADVYTVEFYDGATLLGTKQNVGYFDTFKIINFNAPSITGMTFLGWSMDPAATSPSYSSGNELSRLTDQYGATVKFYTVWDANRYIVSYNANGGTGAPAPQTVRYGQTGYIPSQIPARYGYTFKGWGESFLTDKVVYTANDPYVNLCSKNNETYSLFAVWEPDTFKIRFNATGATNGGTVTKTLVYGYDFTVEVYAFGKTGYYIEGWATEPNATTKEFAADVFTMPQVNDFYGQSLSTEDHCIDLYPVWKEITFAIKLDPNGGTLSGEIAHSLKYSKSLLLTAPTRDYYTFEGWECEYNGEIYRKGQTVTGSTFKNLQNEQVIYLVAKWKLAKYDITYDLDGGKGSTSNKTGVSVTTSVSLPGAPTKEGYTFEGWICSVDGSVHAAGTSKSNWANSTDKSVTFTAKWKEKP